MVKVTVSTSVSASSVGIGSNVAAGIGAATGVAVAVGERVGVGEGVGVEKAAGSACGAHPTISRLTNPATIQTVNRHRNTSPPLPSSPPVTCQALSARPALSPRRGTRSGVLSLSKGQPRPRRLARQPAAHRPGQCSCRPHQQPSAGDGDRRTCRFHQRAGAVDGGSRPLWSGDELALNHGLDSIL